MPTGIRGLYWVIRDYRRFIAKLVTWEVYDREWPPELVQRAVLREQCLLAHHWPHSDNAAR